MYFLMMSYDTVEMIKQFLGGPVDCSSMLFHADAVYIGIRGCVIQWNIVTDSVVRLEGYPSSVFTAFF
jgi:hypothetical protein